MALEEITEEALRDEHPLLIGSCNCSEYSTFIYIGRQDLTEAIKKKWA